MDWVSIESEKERRAQELKAAERQRRQNELLKRAAAQDTDQAKGNGSRGNRGDAGVRHAVGGKLVEWGTRLQESPAR